MHNLNDNWIMWIHLPNDSDWSLSSYKQIYSFNTLEDCIKIVEFLNNNILTKLVIFFMKNNIKPIWEDENNKNGGSFSYKISNIIVEEVWKKLSYSLICNSLINDEKILKNINGISISPKKNYCIIKFWLNNIENFKNTQIDDFIEKSLKNYESINNYNDNNNENIINKKDPFDIDNICEIDKQLCVFKKHNSIY